METEVARDLAAAIRAAVPDVTFGVEGAERFGHEPGYRSTFESTPDAIVGELHQLLDRPVTKLLARHETMPTEELFAIAQGVVGELAALATATFSVTDGLLELSAAGVTKAFGLERLAADHGIAHEEVVAFGDMPNDLAMLEWAGWSVAVANAHPDVLAIADEITASCDDDGVAQVIERLLTS
jgi:hydroxymethylpyrimidine pyrophosphatase-like HAD family hydrolase